MTYYKKISTIQNCLYDNDVPTDLHSIFFDFYGDLDESVDDLNNKHCFYKINCSSFIQHIIFVYLINNPDEKSSISVIVNGTHLPFNHTITASSVKFKFQYTISSSIKSWSSYEMYSVGIPCNIHSLIIISINTHFRYFLDQKAV